MTIGLDKETTALIAACIAAAVSLFVLLYRIRADKAAEYRQKNRERLEPMLEDLGEALYQVVASSVLYEVKSGNQNYYSRMRSDNIRKLSNIRPKVRYPLWGIDDGFKVLILLPGILKDKEESGKRVILELCSSLRLALDKSIKNCHQFGRKPTYIDRLKVKYLVRKIRNRWGELNEIKELEAYQQAQQKKKKNVVKHSKIKAKVLSRNDETFIAQDESGKQYTVPVKFRSGRGSRSLVGPGVDVHIYKRDGEDFYRYRIDSPSQYKMVGESKTSENESTTV